MKPPRSPSELFPASVPNVSARFVSLSTGVRLRIAESGPADGVPVLMLHGWGGSLYMYRHALAALPASGIRVIAVDLRGYGLSDKPLSPGAYSLNAYGADLDALLDALELRRAALVGHSMAGGLALRYALRRPERVTRLVLINPAGLVPMLYPRVLGIAPRGISYLLHRRFVRRRVVRWILRHIAYGNAALATENDVEEYWAPTQLAGYVQAAHAALHEFDWRPLSPAEAASLTVPTIVIIGTRDRLIRSAYEAATQLNGARVYALDGGHCVHEEFPDEVYGIIGQFVR